jgi:hypothetical protein
VGTPLLFPAEVIYEVDPEMFDHFRPDELAVMVEKANKWNYLADRHVDAEIQIVSASAVYLSSFALVSMPTLPPPAQTGPADRGPGPGPGPDDDDDDQGEDQD